MTKKKIAEEIVDEKAAEAVAEAVAEEVDEADAEEVYAADAKVAETPIMSLDSYIGARKWTAEETERRIIAAINATALSGKGVRVSELYGVRLECRNVVVDPEKRKIATADAGNIEVRKTAWNVTDNRGWRWYWVDTYTAACEDFAVRLLESLGEGPWPVYYPIVFAGQLTKMSKDENDLKAYVKQA